MLYGAYRVLATRFAANGIYRTVQRVAITSTSKKPKGQPIQVHHEVNICLVIEYQHRGVITRAVAVIHGYCFHRLLFSYVLNIDHLMGNCQAHFRDISIKLPYGTCRQTTKS